MNRNTIFGVVFSMAFYACSAQKSEPVADTEPYFINTSGDTIQRLVLSDKEWAQQLDPEAFRVLRKHGTERAFTGALWDTKDKGIYLCAGCGLPLFASDTKYDSGTGWPSYYAPIDPMHIGRERDISLGMLRTEVRCNRCGGHLGHVFDDGPRPTGLRYCINSAALRFEEN